MDFKQLIQYLNSLYDTFRKDWKTFNNYQIDAIEKNTKAIENKEITEEVSINNTKDIINPILEAQNATTEAIKAIPSVEIPKVDFSSLEGKIEALLVAFKEKEMVVNVGKTEVNVDNKSVVKAIEELKKSIPKLEKEEVIDYTLMLDELMKILERPKDHSEIKKLQELVKKLGTTDDLIAIAEWLKIIALKEFPEPQELPIKDGRILVSVDKVGGGGGGLTSTETGYLKNTSDQLNNLHFTGDKLQVDAVIETGDIEIGAVEIKDATSDTRATVGTNGLYTEVRASALPSGAATSDKQDSQTTVLQSIAGFNLPAYTYVARAWNAGTFTETWTFKTGGSGGTTVGTITIVYDDVNMSNIVSVTKI